MNLKVQDYLQNSKRLARQADAARYIYKHGLFPKGKEEDMRDIIASYDSMVEKWF